MNILFNSNKVVLDGENYIQFSEVENEDGEKDFEEFNSEEQY